MLAISCMTARGRKWASADWQTICMHGVTFIYQFFTSSNNRFPMARLRYNFLFFDIHPVILHARRIA